MRIAIVGVGMLGKDLVSVLEEAGHDVTSFNSSYDICDVKWMWKIVLHCDLVIHCAAFTNVDLCEYEVAAACKINIEGTNNVAMFCEQEDIPMIYISTDQVFDGKNIFRYCEKSIPDPKNVYGMTKYLGERVVESIVKKHYILRTAWLYGKHKSNYIDYYRNSEGSACVPDSISNPTSTVALSRMISKLISVMPESGIYNAVCSGSVSKKELAEKLSPGIDCEKWSSMAPRPYRTDLSNDKLAAVIGPIPTWEQSLQEYLGE